MTSLALPLLVGSLFAGGVALASESWDDRLSLNAYGTVGFARSSSATPGYRTNYAYQHGIGKAWSGGLDNIIGGQLSVKLDRDVSLVTQAIVRRNSDDKIAPELTWAYLRWKPDATWEYRVGRVRQALFLISEEFDVGFSQPWARPPAELYSLAGENTTIDGLQIRHRQPAGRYTLSLEGHAGVNQVKRQTYTVRSPLNTGLAITLADSALTLRASLLRADIDYNASRLQPIYGLIAAQNPDVAREYAPGDIAGIYYGSLGARYESANWLVMTELAQIRSPRRIVPEYQAGYLTVGRVQGQWMPYVTVSRIRTLSSVQEDRLGGLAGLAANELLSKYQRSQSALSLGARWDAYPGIAFKAQLDWVRPDTGSYGLQTTPLPPGKSSFAVVSLIMNWAF